MADHLPSGLLEACVVVGASGDKLKDVYQSLQQGNSTTDLLILDPEVLQVHVPPFVTKENADESGVPRTFSRVQCRRSFIKKKERLVVAPSGPGGAGSSEGATVTEDVSVPKDIDLMALPQLCFPGRGGLQVTNEPKEERFHFLVFTDVFGNQTHGVVVQCCRPFQEGSVFYQNGHWSSTRTTKLYTAFAICVISKHPYYNALKDCLSCLLVQLRTCRLSEERVKEFAAKLSLVPIPPPGQLHVVFNLRPLMIVLPSREDKEHPAVDLDLHLPFLCFRSKQILQIITGILMEQRVVFFSADWARLTLVAECFMFYIHPLHWQHPYVPILSAQMLDFIMAPTAFLMGCHLNHFEEVAAETDDLILINIDDGTVSSSCSETVDLPDVPFVSAECFTKRRKGLQLQYDLEVCHQGAGTDVNEMRMLRRQWQQNLNWEIQKVTLELIVNMFRDVSGHLNYEHRVFNSEEFLKTRELADLPFYRKVLETHIFHSFLKDRLNRKMDAFTRMEVNTRSETQKMKAMTDNPRRPTMQEMARKYSSNPEIRLNKRLGMSLPNLGEERHLNLLRQTSLKKTIIPESAFKIPPKPVKIFKLTEFPPPMVHHHVQNYYGELIILLGKAISCVPPEDSTLLARYFYLRGFMNTLCSKRLDALSDFQNLYKTDIEIFPTDLVKALVDSLQKDEFSQVDRWPELKRLIFKVKTDNEMVLVQADDHVKKFQLPKTHMLQEDFVKRIQESGIVKDVATIHRLFEALTVGQHNPIDPEVFYTFCFQGNRSRLTQRCSVCSTPSGRRRRWRPRMFTCQLRSWSTWTTTSVSTSCPAPSKPTREWEVKISFAPFLLLRIPSLKIKCSLRKEVFEANLKSACDLWNLMVREMWAGRTMADDHKDPQYMQQALTNVLLMDAVVGCLQTQKAIFAASKLAYFDRVKHEAVPVMVPKTTLETLKHKINPSLDLPAPQTVHVLLYTPGQLSYSEADGDGNPKLWCALSGGRVVVFDAASWSMQQNCVQVGSSQLNCMLGLDQDQVWIGSQDSIIYIIDTRSMSCNKQLTEHRHEVMDFALEESDKMRQTYSCSADGTVILWDLSTLKVKKQFQLTCDRLMSIQLFNGTLWCCARDGIVELRKNGTPHRKMTLPEDLRSMSTEFSSLILFLERGQLWTSCSDSDELCLWHCKDLTKPFLRVRLQNCTGVNCMIKVKNQIWVGCSGPSPDQCRMSGKIYIVDTESHSVEKELMAHTDSVQALCSAEGRYVLSGSACQDGKIAIWKVE
ncbi:DENN domain-containing protein 3-like isoform X5 [Oncorhynchus kisutch]|uniref:DENN domain-containing protein 3 isoform X5 n=1 Tax=Oncorhynchus kisutch TaxID=8019 RepID=UPI0012DD24E2|nr:DENN domain-containing protein 3 isoform X5 [Oncorhynchus kisutch]XP_031674190.1 DENN domain-containing protein 3-like isoform X5 [Oncorhynchus kisutch]